MSRSAVLAASMMLVAAPALAQSKAAIQQLENEWAAAFNKGDAKAVAAMYTPDAYVLPSGGELVHGTQAIEALWQQAMGQLGDIKCTALNVRPLGPDAASEIGTCTFKTKAQPPKPGALKYTVVWQNRGGAWKLETDSWNMNK